MSLGIHTGQYFNTGARSTAVGSQALLPNTIGNQNTAVGFQSLSFNTSGSNNTAIGNNNVGVGYMALWSNAPIDFLIVIAKKYSTILDENTQLHHLLLYNLDTQSILNLTLYTHLDLNKGGYLPEPRIYGNIKSHNTHSLNEVYNNYVKILPNWLMMYQYMVKDDMLGCRDIFTHMLDFYPASLNYK